ncbi:MAG: tetratricopeptide repeat protein [Lachnoclostridium sp.]|nr:tetratricopeptide repeat protein [Lachnoclostridium sp.]
MKSIDIEVNSLLEARRINDAVATLENAALNVAVPGLIDRIRRISLNYNYLAGYALDGVNDPSREALLTDIMTELSGLATEIKRHYLAQSDSSLYFSTLRTIKLREQENDECLMTLMAEYRDAASRYSLALMSQDAPLPVKLEMENIEKRIFAYVWTRYPLLLTEADIITEALADPTFSDSFKSLLLGAVFMGLDAFFDQNRLLVLMEAYKSGSDALSMRALTALLLGLWIHRKAFYSRRIHIRFAALAETCPSLQADLRNVLMQIVRTRDTDRVTRIITDEVIPEMMKLRPEIEKSMKQSPNPIDPEANPEWEELLEKSGVAEKMRELQELQEDGADVMMSSFGRLKTFPFFNDISNWFLPFAASHSINNQNGDISTLATMMEENHLFCDNDKFSFVLSIKQIPVAHQEIIRQQLDTTARQMKMMQQGDTITPADSRRIITRNFTRDLYRFFKLFRRKGEFNSPFAQPINPWLIPIAGPMLQDEELLTVLGEFYFKNKYWHEASNILSRIPVMTIPLLQKLGYCCQQTGDHGDALDYYSEAEMLGDNSRWLLRKLAACYKNMHNHRKSLEYLRRLEAETPDDLQVAMLIGQALMKLGEYSEALRYLYKVEYMNPGKASRLIAWAAFITGDLDKSESMWQQILQNNPGATDLLNAGHLYLVKGDLRKAASLYAQSIAARDFNSENFIIDFAADRKTLRDKGIDEFIEGIVIDEAIRLSNNLGKPLTHNS